MSVIVLNAIALGTKAHECAVWNAGRPYIDHLTSVAEILRRFGFDDEDLQAAAYLHDAAEDGGTTLEEIEKQCGVRVASLVWAVTDEPGHNRKERKLATYPKIRRLTGATTLKLADRISNVEESSRALPSRYLDMYRKEYRDFKEALFVENDVNKAMWDHLDKFLES